MKPAPEKLRCDGITFEEALHPESFQMPRHSHDETHMVLLFAGGIESYSYNRRSMASPSDLLFVPAGETHTSRYHDSVHAFYIQFRSSWWERVQQQMPTLELSHEYQNSPPTWLAMRLFREFHKRDNLTPFMLEGLTLELLVTMSRHTEPLEGNTIPRWLRQVQEYLHAHFTGSLSVDALAEAAGVHPGHLMRGFRQHYRCTIGDYVRRLRVEHACHLLSDSTSTQSLTQIALSLGFADQSHFCKTFKQVTGLTPTEMRNLSGDVSLKQKTRS